MALILQEYLRNRMNPLPYDINENFQNTTLEIPAGKSLATLAGELYGDVTYFRELADSLDINEFNPESIAGLVVEVPKRVEAFKTKLVELEESIKNFENIDLSAISSGGQLSPQQLIEWLL
jgi:hypothetical protein